MIGIYILEFSNGAKYIGQSNNIPRRIEEHMEDLRGVHRNKKLRAAYASCGAPNYRVLEECSLAQLNNLEIKWIAHYDTFRNGCNQTIGGGYPRKLGSTAKTFPEPISAFPVKVLIAAFIMIVAFLLAIISPWFLLTLALVYLCLR